MANVLIPFDAAAHHHVEGPFFDESFTPGAASVNILTGSQGEVPAYPYLRFLWLFVSSSGGAKGTGAPVLAADAPFNIFESVQFSDANGAAIVGGIGAFSGYDLFLANKYGGYAFTSDPEGLPDYSTTVEAPSFAIRIPIEFDDRIGAGSLGNMAANAPFRLQLIGNTEAAIWSTVATLTVPAIRVRGFLETWTLPQEQNINGQAQEQVPPGGVGTTQYWRKQTYSVNASSQNIIRFTDVGNLIRSWILVARDSSGARLATNTTYPSPYTLAWDGVPLKVEYPQYRRSKMAESLAYGRYNTAITVGQMEAGVLCFSFADPNGHIDGGDGPNRWIPTLQSSRMELQGTWGASVDSLDVLTNSVAAVDALSPFGFGNQTGQLMGPAQPSTR